MPRTDQPREPVDMLRETFYKIVVDFRAHGAASS
jgi:hypothetical protein